jgi:uncharacterized Zn finger protein
MSKAAITVADIEQRKAALIERGKAVRIMLDAACGRRTERAASLTVVKAVESKETGAITATVQSAADDGTYKVVIEGPERGRVRNLSCTCKDFRRNGRACKHLIAVGTRYVAARRDEYRLLQAMVQMFS